MDAGSGQMVYVYFHSPTCLRDFPGTDFLIFGIVVWGKRDCQNEFFGHNFMLCQIFGLISLTVYFLYLSVA